MAVCRTVVFESPGTVGLRETDVPDPAPDEVRVRTQRSAISPGTERLVLRGEAPDMLQADASIEALGQGLTFPLAYGYCAVGTVDACGADVDAASWTGMRVFAFQPHTSHFTARPDALIPLPDDVTTDDAVFLPNVETAVTLVMDGRPMIGERVAVFGQGVVGLLTTALLAKHPLMGPFAIDPESERRSLALDLGAKAAFSPNDDALRDALALSSADAVDATKGRYEGADLTYELSGRPETLNDAIACTGFSGRVVVGSWYGKKQAPLDLGSRFHRSRMQIQASQVSSLAPELRGRWTKSRRMQVVLNFLSDVSPRRLISHRFMLSEASNAYDALDAGDVLQPVFDYE